MHELSITRNVLAIVAEKAAGRAVEVVRLRIGRLAGIETQAVRFCFDVCTQGTALEGARLEIDEVAGRGRCDLCGVEVALESPRLRCGCREGAVLKVIAGEELVVASMEVASV